VTEWRMMRETTRVTLAEFTWATVHSVAQTSD